MSSQDKMLALLDAFSVEAPVWSTEDLIERSGLPPSTCYRYLKSLHQAGLLARVGSGSYVVGPRVLAMDRIARLTDPVYSVGSPMVQALSQRTGFSALLSVLYSDSVMCVQQVATDDAPKGLFGRGQQRPLVAGATANIILAHLPVHQLRSVFAKQGERIGQAGLGHDWDSLRANLKAIRAAGLQLFARRISPRHRWAGGAAVQPRRQIWLVVPATIRSICAARCAGSTKDLALHLMSLLGYEKKAIYKTIEIGGPGMAALSMDARFTITNYCSDMGAKSAIIEPDDVTLAYVKDRAQRTFTPVRSDADCHYEEVIDVDLATLEPLLACPHALDNIHSVESQAGKTIHEAVIGTCTNGRFEDIASAAAIVAGEPFGVQLAEA